MLCSIYSSMLEMGIMSLQLPDVTIHQLENQDGHVHWYQYQSIKTQKAVFCSDTDEVLSTDRGWSLRHSKNKMLINNILLLFHFCWCTERSYWILKSGLVWFLQVCNSKLRLQVKSYNWEKFLPQRKSAPYVLEYELGPKQGSEIRDVFPIASAPDAALCYHEKEPINTITCNVT